MQFRGVASLSPGWAKVPLSLCSSNFHHFFLFFFKLSTFLSSFWLFGWASYPPRKALATPLMQFRNRPELYYVNVEGDLPVYCEQFIQGSKGLRRLHKAVFVPRISDGRRGDKGVYPQSEGLLLLAPSRNKCKIRRFLANFRFLPPQHTQKRISPSMPLNK